MKTDHHQNITTAEHLRMENWVLSKKQKETMKECTLQEAVELCMENGGTFHKDTTQAAIYYYNNAGAVCEVCNPSVKFKLMTADFNHTWIYEPPKKSAFQEWESHNTFLTETGAEYQAAKQGRKEGWNAALDEVLSTQFHKEERYTQIKALKEV